MIKLMKKLRKNDDGATAIEYGLIAALIALGLVAGLGALEDDVTAFLGTVGDDVQATNPATP